MRQEQTKAYSAAEIIGAARHNRTPENYEALKFDPAIKGDRLGERKVALEMERKQELSGPVTREPTGKADFVDGGGTKWDIKSFVSCQKGDELGAAKIDVKHGGFALDNATDSLRKEIEVKGNNVIIDTRRLNEQDKQVLKNEVLTRDWESRTKWHG